MIRSARRSRERSGAVAAWHIMLRNRMVNSDRIRTKLVFTFLLSLLALCGCAHQYVMKLNNGDQIIAATKPKLQGTSYHFTDNEGGRHVIAQSRVVRIRAVSVEQAERKPAASESPESPLKPKKPKHWYFLWLA
jgi:hypothetical protein